MKSDIIRKRSRHDARRVGSGETPSASPGASRRASPVDGNGQPSGQGQLGGQHQGQDQRGSNSPTLAPDSSMNFGFGDDYDFANPTPQSELMGALGTDPNDSGVYSAGGAFDTGMVYNSAFPGPYHPDYLKTFGLYGGDENANATASGSNHISNAADSANDDDRASKRRRMSVDSVSEPPSSTTSSSYYATESTSATSTSARSSMDFQNSGYAGFPSFNPNGTIRNTSTTGASNNGGATATNSSASGFWHPPLLPQEEHMMKSPHTFGTLHPPLLPPNGNATGSGEFPMDFLHPPMLPQDEHDLFARYIHPPMVDSPMPPMHPPLLPTEGYYTQATQAQAQVQAQAQAQAQVQAQAAHAVRVHEVAQKHAQVQAQQQQQHQQAQGDYYEQNFGSVN